MVMIRLNIHELKAHLSAHLARLGDDEVIVICKRNEPIAELRRLRRRPAKKRPIGKAAGTFELSASFFEPLPEEMLAAFEGTGRS